MDDKEDVTSAIYSGKKAAEWLRFLYYGTEKEIISELRRDNDLCKHRLKFYTGVCKCASILNQCQSDWKQTIEELVTNISCGACCHVLEKILKTIEMNKSQRKISAWELFDTKKDAPTLYRENKEVLKDTVKSIEKLKESKSEVSTLSDAFTKETTDTLLEQNDTVIPVDQEQCCSPESHFNPHCNIHNIRGFHTLANMIAKLELDHAFDVYQVETIHIVAALGKKKVLDFILDYNAKQLGITIDCLETRFEVHSPVYFATVNKLCCTVKVLLRQKPQNRRKFAAMLRESLITAAENDDLKIFKVIWKAIRSNCTSSHSCYLRIKDSYVAAIGKRSLTILKYISKMDYDLNYEYLSNACDFEQVFKNVLLDDDADTVKLTLQLKKFSLDRCLQEALFHGSSEVVRMLLEEYKKRKMIAYPNLIPATLDSDKRMMGILIDYIKLQVDRFTKKSKDNVYTLAMHKLLISSTTWAKILQRYDVIQCLTSVPGLEVVDVKIDIPPLIEVFEKNLCSSVWSKSQLIDELIRKGLNVNAITNEGITPLIRAMEVREYGVIPQLLLAGADPYQGNSCFQPHILTRKFIQMLFDANFNISPEGKSDTLIRYLATDIRRMKVIDNIILYCHSVSSSDKAVLEECLCNADILAMNNGKGLINVKQFLREPRLLTTLCRNSLRRHFGVKLQHFIKIANLPKTIEYALILKGVYLFRGFDWESSWLTLEKCTQSWWW